MSKFLTAAIVALSIAVVGGLLLWSRGMLGAWGVVLDEPYLDSLWLYFFITGATFGVYRFAWSMVAVSPGGKSRSAATWLYVRWVLLSGAIAWIFGQFPGSDRRQADRAMKAFIPLVVVGLIGTARGVKETTTKAGFKQ